MFEYSSNAHATCCEDSSTKGLYNYDHCKSDDLDLHARLQVRLKRDYFLTCNNSDNKNYESYCFQTWQDGRLMLVDAMSQRVGKGTNNQRCELSATEPSNQH